MLSLSDFFDSARQASLFRGLYGTMAPLPSIALILSTNGLHTDLKSCERVRVGGLPKVMTSKRVARGNFEGEDPPF